MAFSNKRDEYEAVLLHCVMMIKVKVNKMPIDLLIIVLTVRAAIQI